MNKYLLNEWINWITKFEYKSIVYSMFIIVINNIN